jgi:hypothetical protein
MGPESEGVEDPKPGQAASDGHEWNRPPPNRLFAHSRTWSACPVDGYRCSVVIDPDVAGDWRLAFFVRPSLYRSLPLGPQAGPGLLPSGAMQTQPDQVSFP